MNILNLFKVSLRAVANNKMRSFLSMLGIIIGVAAVIIMMSIGQGSKESIRKELSTMGTNLLTIRPGADMRGGVRQDPSAMQTLKMADYERIVREKRFVTKVSPEVTASGQAIYGNPSVDDRGGRVLHRGGHQEGRQGVRGGCHHREGALRRGCRLYR